MVATKAGPTATDAEQALVNQWRDIQTVHARTHCELDRELQPYGLGASDFEVLDVLATGLAEDGTDAFRVQDIACQVHLSQSALSRLIGRLEKDGLVERGMCSEDRRGVRVCITEKGSRVHAEARPVQRTVLARMLPGAGA
ncbi:MarR family winged helix-turn-helix transcriptional regulator [Streptomyces flavofungini]|uniref:MarR family winged helix-turn-helix transcriptional regulator n=1 Tax=Streptomyces flavofungini TaxID=68200 RepID=UPI0025B023BC|nr:MarR family transcriptional regulator [Streptomyces flavofungini]WJV50467.1 MarR family transcriptional regulator [Streptomyces flavofungini]